MGSEKRDLVFISRRTGAERSRIDITGVDQARIDRMIHAYAEPHLRWEVQDRPAGRAALSTTTKGVGDE